MHVPITKDLESWHAHLTSQQLAAGTVAVMYAGFSHIALHALQLLFSVFARMLITVKIIMLMSPLFLRSVRSPS